MYENKYRIKKGKWQEKEQNKNQGHYSFPHNIIFTDRHIPHIIKYIVKGILI